MPDTQWPLPRQPSPDDAPVTLGREDGVLGEVVLRRRQECGTGMHELVVGGVLLMDDRDTSTERALVDAALERIGGGDLAVVVGGLGLGFSLAAALADDRVRRVLVAEIEPALVRWVGAGLVPATADLLDDPRVEVRVADVREVLAGLPPACVDVVALDVDNGPGFLVHEANAALYRHGGLAAARAVLRPGGVLAVWSSHRAPDLRAVLTDVVGSCEERLLTVTRAGRDLEYALYLARVA